MKINISEEIELFYGGLDKKWDEYLEKKEQMDKEYLRYILFNRDREKKKEYKNELNKLQKEYYKVLLAKKEI